jgi:hypothetical protein
MLFESATPLSAESAARIEDLHRASRNVEDGGAPPWNGVR